MKKIVSVILIASAVEANSPRGWALSMKNFFLFFVLTFFFLVQDAVAFTCRYPSFDDAFENAASIFIGRVVETNTSYMKPDLYGKTTDKTKFQLMQVWKGNKVKYIDLLSERMPNFFGAEFKVGKEYLIFAENSKDRRNLILRGCGIYKPLKYACPLVSKLNEQTSVKGNYCGN